MPGLIDDLVDRLSALESIRRPWEAHWDDVAKYVVPGMERLDLFQSIDRVVNEPTAAQRSPDIYDHTSIWAVDRLSAGEISLVMPASAKWHTLRSSEPNAGDPTDVEEEWFDATTNFLFTSRYNPASGFTLASKAAVKSRAAFGMGVMYTEPAFGRMRAPISYRYIPLGENYLATNFEGNVDTNYRVFRRTAAQCVERWGDACSEKTRKSAENPRDKDRQVEIVHAVFPMGDMTDAAGDKAFASYYFEKEEKHLIGKGGYFTFPYTVFHWNREHQGPYTEGPVAMAIAEIKSLNMLSKQEYIATQQWINPPTAQRSDDHNRPNLQPGAPNPGLLNEQGELLVKPIITQQRPDLARAVIEAKQNQIRESLYVNLWQILIQNPQMTATEALIRSQEKADLLSPSGLSLQAGLSHMVDRELDIYSRRGAFDQGAPLEAPEAVQGRDIGATFTGPLDKLRRASEVIGIERTLQMMANVAQTVAVARQSGSPELAAKLDVDAILELAQEINGAPQKMFKTRDEIEEERDRDAQMQQLMGAIEAFKQGGDAAKATGDGVQALNMAGMGIQ